MRIRKVQRAARGVDWRYLSEPLESRVLLDAFVVRNTADAGVDSLRQAITDANAHLGLDTISFQIPGAGVHAITPLSVLPQISDPVVIDGTTQTGYATTPLIQLNGSSAGNVDGLDIAAGGSTVKALAVSNFTFSGISIFTNGGNSIQNCFLGTDPAGTVAAGNGDDGIVISGGSANNQILNNLISGNGTVNNFPGVQIFGAGTSNNTLSGNKIGTNLAGTAAVQNCGGIIISTGASANQVLNNLISGNGLTSFFSGIQIWGAGTNSNVVAGNRIGTDVTGSLPLGNGGSGVLINFGAQSNRVGTNGDGVNDAAERNIVSANGVAQDYTGIVIADSGTNGNIVAGNYVGTDVTGTVALGNRGSGIAIGNGAQSNRVGVNGGDADAAGERNVVSANGFPDHFGGIAINDAGTNGNIVAGNYIGTDVTGLLPLATAGAGIGISNGSQNNLIGTNGDGVGDTLERNVIANSGYQGVYLADPNTSGNRIAGNYIGANAAGAPAANLFNGIWVTNGATNDRIGSNGTDVDAAGEGNLIIANRYVGILVTDPTSGHTTGITIRGNSVHNNNATMGIDLGNDGFNANHASAILPGPNNFLNHPVLLSATPGASANVTGTYVSTANGVYTIDFYANSAADGPFDGAGDRWLGFVTVTTSAAGVATFSANVGTAAAGEWITATATDAGGNTSEFSTPIQLPTAPIQLGAGKWTPVGPAPINENKGNGPTVTGRVDAAATDPTNPNVVYIASDIGGVWKTTDWLDPIPQWTPLTDNQPSTSFGDVSYTALAIAPSNSQTLYAAVSWPGGGILKSTNGGSTWTELANANFNGAQFASLVIDPTNANTLYASVWFGAASGIGGVYKSTDGGVSWSNTTASLHTTGGAADLIIDPTAPLILYAGLVGDTTNGAAANGIYKTIDGGAHWNLLTNGVISGTAVGVSVRLAISPSSPQVLYATVYDPALGNAPQGVPHRYRTVNGGASWTPLAAVPLDEPRYWHAVLAVDPHNSSIVYTNGDHTLQRSVDGGATWNDVYDEDPVNVCFDDGGAVILTGDRGIYRWAGGNALVENKHGNLQNVQFYSITLDPADPAIAYGIAQDQIAGLKTNGAAVWNYMGGADEVGRVIVDPTNPAVLYEYDPNNGGTASNQEAVPAAAPPVPYFVWRSTDGGATWASAGIGIPTAGLGFGLAYTSQRAFLMDPTNHNRLLLGTDGVYESTDQAGSWHAVSPVLSAGKFISALGIAASAPNTLYAATEDGKLFATTNNSTWSERDTGLPLDPFDHVMDIQVDPANPQRAFVACGQFLNGYSANNHVFMTINGGLSWSNITGNLPNDDAGQSIAVDWRFATPRLYVGTLRGIFLSTDTGVHWTSFGGNLPNTIVTDLEISTTANILAAATHGRGAFEIRIPASTSDSVTGTAAADAVALVQDTDHLHIDWTMGANTGQLLITDVNGLTVTGNGGTDSITLDYTNGNPLPNTIHLNGTFALNGMQGTNPLANTTLELARSTVYISYASPASDPLSLVKTYLRNGYNSGAWNGAPTASTGVIISSAAQANAQHTSAIGYADSADAAAINPVANTILLKYAVVGDTDLDGTVGLSDYTAVVRNFGTGTNWDQGVVTYGAVVGLSDYTAVVRNFGKTTPAAAAAAVIAARAVTTATEPNSTVATVAPTPVLTPGRADEPQLHAAVRHRRNHHLF